MDWHNTTIPTFSVKSLEVEMQERGVVCLVSGALALMFPVMCCPGFPGCFPESRPWVLSLGAVVIRHSLHVISYISLLIIPCIIYHVTNKETLNLDELCGQGSAGMSMSSACFGCVALSLSLWDSSTT